MSILENKAKKRFIANNTLNLGGSAAYVREIRNYKPANGMI